MLDLSLPADAWEQAIKDLVERGTPESLVLDYKADRYGKEKAGANREIAKDVSAFANAEGGQIIVGVQEKSGIPVHALGFQLPSWDEALRVEDVCTSGISPKVDGLIVRTVRCGENETRGFLVVSVPQSASAPHMVVADKDYRYYTRRNLKSEPMEESEVRLLHESRYGALQRVDQFLDSLEPLYWPQDELEARGNTRIELVACPLFLAEGRINPAQPECSGWARQFGDRFREWSVIEPPDSVLPAEEGLRLQWRDYLERPWRRVQVFRSGCLRLTSLWQQHAGDGRRFIRGTPLVKLVRFFLPKAAEVLQKAGYFGEVRLRFRIFEETIVYLVRRGDFDDESDRKPCHGWGTPTPLHEITSSFELTSAPDAPARRLADRLWNCFAWPRCDLWDEQGMWVAG